MEIKHLCPSASQALEVMQPSKLLQAHDIQHLPPASIGKPVFSWGSAPKAWYHPYSQQ